VTSNNTQRGLAVEAEKKPRFRGVSHQYAFFVSLLTGTFLVLMTKTDRAFYSTLVYVLSLTALLGTSALYHRVDWSKPSRRAWMRRLDHTMIFVLIAGTYTPFALLGLGPDESRLLLIVLWTSVGLGMILRLCWLTAPKWVTAIVFVIVGSIGGFTFPGLLAETGPLCLVLILLGGFFYISGACIYALKRPNPWPASFGYHEIFHAFVIIGAGFHYSAIAVIISLRST